MSENIAIVAKDYRILKTVKVKPEGITLIYGNNSAGKSTIAKALVTLMTNQSSEDNFRHGTDSFAIAVQIGGSRVKYTRTLDKVTLQYNDEEPRTKLGRHPLSVLEPRFPLKRVDYETSSFYPNFSFQNSVPIFNDISVYDLFSSMFSSIAKVSDRLQSLRSESLSLSKQKTSLEANVELSQQEYQKSTQSRLELEADLAATYGAPYEDYYKSLKS